MIGIPVCILFLFLLVWRPVVAPYLALLYLFIIGLSGRLIVDQFKLTLGNINVFPMDLTYVFAVMCCLIYLARSCFSYKFKKTNTLQTNKITIFILLLVLFYLFKLANAFLNNMPANSIVRMFMSDTQVLYFFIPFIIYKNIGQLSKLLYFVVFLSLIFPLCQPLLINSKATVLALQGQDTLRLGFGDGNVLLGLGFIGLLCWEYNKYLSFLPLSGILMLAHRSAFIAVFLSLVSVAFLKEKKIRTFASISVAVVLVFVIISTIQYLTKSNLLDQSLNRVGETFHRTKTTLAREKVITVAIDEFQKRPIVGFAYAERHSNELNVTGNWRIFDMAHPHNFFLASIMNNGIVGTILLLILITNAMLTANKLARNEASKMSGIYLFCSMLFFVIYATMNTTMTTVGYVFWYLCGITFWILNQQKLQNSVNENLDLHPCL